MALIAWGGDCNPSVIPKALIEGRPSGWPPDGAACSQERVKKAQLTAASRRYRSRGSTARTRRHLPVQRVLPARGRAPDRSPKHERAVAAAQRDGRVYDQGRRRRAHVGLLLRLPRVRRRRDAQRVRDDRGRHRRDRLQAHLLARHVDSRGRERRAQNLLLGAVERHTGVDPVVQLLRDDGAL